MNQHVTLFAALLACAAPQRPATKPATKPAPRVELAKLLAKEGVTIDAQKKLVTAEGRVTVTNDFLEYVAIGPHGKKHEALVTLRCKGSTLNAALLALGLTKGTNVAYEKIEPMPTEAEVMKGAPTMRVIPPKGTAVHLALRWLEPEGGPKTYAVDDLIIDLRAEREGSPILGAKWIYLGGRMAELYRGEPKVFVADYEQNYTSCYYAKPDNHLITILHERGNFDDNWYPRSDLLPDAGTPCKLIISLEPVTKRVPLDKLLPKSRPSKGSGSGDRGKRDR